MTDPWTPYGGKPQGIDPVGAIPGISGWLMLGVGIATVVMGVWQLSMVVEGVKGLGMKPTDANIVGLILSFLPVIGASIATYGAVLSGEQGLVRAVVVYFWPYALLLVGILCGLLRSDRRIPTTESEDPSSR